MRYQILEQATADAIAHGARYERDQIGEALAARDRLALDA